MERDMISTLPKTILHDILSRMPEEDAVRTSVLSKSWAEAWSTYPILYFSDTMIVGTFPRPWEDFLRKRKNFIDHVKRTLLRFHTQGLAIKQFRLIINFDLQYMSLDVDHWLKLASESGVQVLEICLPKGHEQDEKALDPCYILPTGIIEAKSLYKLVLMGGIRVDQAFLSHSVKFFSLRVLSLWSVLLEDEQAIEHLISCCPLIEDVTLKCCSVLNNGGIGGLLEPRTSRMQSISMNALPKLKKVDVQGIPEIIIIDAPSLEYFCFCPGGDVHSPFKMNFDKCRNLRVLYLWSLKSTTITDKWFLDLFTKFPFLECLKFVNCTMSETINISSAQLKVLELSNCSKLKELNLDAPNLLSCGYCGDGASKPIISFLKSSSQLEVNAQIDIDFMDLHYLRECIQNFKPQNVLASLSLFIHQPIVDELNLEILPVSSSPPSIKHLDLRAVPKNETLYLPLVNSVLSSCCPATISLSLNSFFCSRAFIEFFYETLTGRKEDECFCSSGHIKCWWHGLKDVKVSSTRKADENIDFKTMLDALPTFSHHDNIIFRLEL